MMEEEEEERRTARNPHREQVTRHPASTSGFQSGIRIQEPVEQPNSTPEPVERTVPEGQIRKLDSSLGSLLNDIKEEVVTRHQTDNNTTGQKDRPPPIKIEYDQQNQVVRYQYNAQTINLINASSWRDLEESAQSMLTAFEVVTGLLQSPLAASSRPGEP